MTDIIAIDPGGTTTGIVWLRADEEPARLMGSWALRGSLKHFRDWWYGTGLFVEDEFVVVLEEFVNRGVPGVDLSPLHLQGGIEMLLIDVPGMDWELQPASGKNTAVTDDAMKRAGFDKKMFQGDHHQDRWEALRHGLWYLKRHKHLPTLNAMYPR
jgi:hypothetical protein